MIATPDRTPLPGAFFDRPVVEVAPDLRGRLVLRTTPDGPIAPIAPIAPITLRLTDVEPSDGPNDPGSHACRIRAARNGVMSGPPGHAYVSFTYACQGGQHER